MNKTKAQREKEFEDLTKKYFGENFSFFNGMAETKIKVIIKPFIAKILQQERKKWVDEKVKVFDWEVGIIRKEERAKLLKEIKKTHIGETGCPCYQEIIAIIKKED